MLRLSHSEDGFVSVMLYHRESVHDGVRTLHVFLILLPPATKL